ncbi:hypothetical protein CHK_0782 [Christensenella hongkongensis]|uniref:Uncharacterized protein n=1 Tax=Christensenella hongkongensis TaxID=270498 RepID=A0A0M2NKY1_9FIRM|nr:hypothetical protein CHK_0782 [Christensenella hongkongensis]
MQQQETVDVQATLNFVSVSFCIKKKKCIDLSVPFQVKSNHKGACCLRANEG